MSAPPVPTSRRVRSRRWAASASMPADVSATPPSQRLIRRRSRRLPTRAADRPAVRRAVRRTSVRRSIGLSAGYTTPRAPFDRDAALRCGHDRRRRRGAHRPDRPPGRASGGGPRRRAVQHRTDDRPARRRRRRSSAGSRPTGSGRRCAPPWPATAWTCRWAADDRCADDPGGRRARRDRAPRRTGSTWRRRRRPGSGPTTSAPRSRSGPDAVHVGTLGLVARADRDRRWRTGLGGLDAGTLRHGRPELPAADHRRPRRLPRAARRGSSPGPTSSRSARDDLAYLDPEAPAADAAPRPARRRSVGRPPDGRQPRRSRVVARGVRVRRRRSRRSRSSTRSGPGDAFGGGFLARWIERGLGRAELADAGARPRRRRGRDRGRRPHLRACRRRSAASRRGRPAGGLTAPAATLLRHDPVRPSVPSAARGRAGARRPGGRGTLGRGRRVAVPDAEPRQPRRGRAGDPVAPDRPRLPGDRRRGVRRADAGPPSSRCRPRRASRADGIVDDATWAKLIMPIGRRGGRPGRHGRPAPSCAPSAISRSPSTASYGADTVAAVKAFQRHAGLTPTGTMNGATWRRLIAHFELPVVQQRPRCATTASATARRTGRRQPRSTSSRPPHGSWPRPATDASRSATSASSTVATSPGHETHERRPRRRHPPDAQGRGPVPLGRQLSGQDVRPGRDARARQGHPARRRPATSSSSTSTTRSSSRKA